MSSNKIFCIGLNKTGTTSLHEAFKMLGYKSVHYHWKDKNIKKIILENHHNNKPLLNGIEDFDAYLDWNNANTNFLFQKFDEQYPNSKFILNTRDLDGWLRSREKHVRTIPNLKQKQEQEPNNTWYNIDKEAWTKVYDEHHKQVLDYFKNREDDFIVFNLFEGDGWEKLCEFLDKPVPKKTFPMANKSSGKFSKLFKKVKKKIQSVFQ